MKAPKIIYLQIDGDSFGEWEGATWCQDKINDTDVEYVRVDKPKYDENEYERIS